MRFLVDAQLPPKLADWLRAKGHEADHVGEALGYSTPDVEIIAASRMNESIIITKDADFVELVKTPPPQMVWVRMGNVRTSRLLSQFEADLPRILTDISHGAAIVEIR